MITEQQGKCAICKSSLSIDEYKVDHCHQDEKIRGLLCHRCNVGLGHFQDSTTYLSQALVYLKKAEAPTRASDITGEVPESYKDTSRIKIRKDALLLTGDGAFYTLQGEGPTLGMPCVFVRLHHCNLHCTFCDAYYSWKRNSREFWVEPYSLEFFETQKLIEETAATRCKRIVWTGGEPLIQKTQIMEVAKLLGPGWVHEVETNGTLMPLDSMINVFNDYLFQFNVSPKLKNNEADRKELRIRPKILETLSNPVVNASFKFVCRNEADLQEIERDYLPHIPEDRIIIMPEGVIEEEISHHAKLLYEPVLERGWRMTPRFQAIFADGARRGV